MFVPDPSTSTVLFGRLRTPIPLASNFGQHVHVFSRRIHSKHSVLLSLFDSVISIYGIYTPSYRLQPIDALVYNASGGFGGFGPALNIDADALLNGMKVTAVSALVASQTVRLVVKCGNGALGSAAW